MFRPRNPLKIPRLGLNGRCSTLLPGEPERYFRIKSPQRKDIPAQPAQRPSISRATSAKRALRYVTWTPPGALRAAPKPALVPFFYERFITEVETPARRNGPGASFGSGSGQDSLDRGH